MFVTEKEAGEKNVPIGNGVPCRNYRLVCRLKLHGLALGKEEI